MKNVGALPTVLCFLVLRSQILACDDAPCMSVATVPAEPGSRSVAVEIRGRADGSVRGFSLALGHDSSRLRLTRVEPGPLFVDAELLSTTVRNQSSSESAPHGALFVVLDSIAPLDRQPVDLSSTTVLATFFYDVEPNAPEGETPLILANRSFGARPVSVIFVNLENLEVFPQLSDGVVVVCQSGGIDSVVPAQGTLSGGTPVTILGTSFGLGSRVFFGSREATVDQVVGTTRLEVLTPPGVDPGAVRVAVDSDIGCSLIADGFDYEMAPMVASMRNSVGRGDQFLVIEGSGFTPGTRAFVGDLELTDIVVVDASRLEGHLGSCTLQDQFGLHDLRVENNNGTGTLPGAFECVSGFRRGECNGDGVQDLSDAVFPLFFLFSGTPRPVCEDACDANDDGQLDVTDVIEILDFLFRGGNAPAAPFPGYGVDPTLDTLPCPGGNP